MISKYEENSGCLREDRTEEHRILAQVDDIFRSIENAERVALSETIQDFTRRRDRLKSEIEILDALMDVATRRLFGD